MLHLPVEVRRLCIESPHNDSNTLKALRLVNKELGALATEALFHKAVLNPTDESAEALMELTRSKHSSNVRCVVFNTSLHSDSDSEEYEEEESKLLKSVGKTISSISNLKRLEELQLNFAEECAASSGTVSFSEKSVAETTFFRSRVLKKVFMALKGVSNLKDLSIKNLQDKLDRKVFESEHFRSVRDKITGVHLQITTETDEAAPEDDWRAEACHQGFTIDLPECWLKPILPRLTHLSLYSYTCLWGIFPLVDFRDIGTFPCLKSLSLGNYTIAHDWQIDWILSHAFTLEQLLLDDCPIITTLKMEEDMARVNFPDLEILPESIGTGGNGFYFKHISLRWHNVFDRFRLGLPHLQHFASCSSGGNWPSDAFEQRYNLTNKLAENKYHMFDCHIGPSPWQDPRVGTMNCEFYLRGMPPDCEYLTVKFPKCDDEDTAALARLMRVVNGRTSARV